MLSEEQAVAVVSEYWNADVFDPRDQFALRTASLAPERDFWIVGGNTKAWVVDDDFMRASVGIGGFLVDANSGELFVVGSAQKPADVLQDLRDTRAAAGLCYVLAAGTGSVAHSEVVALRKALPCGMMHARQLLASPGRYWFTGPKRLLESHCTELQRLGIPSEVILIDDPANAIPVDWPDSFSWDWGRLAEQIETRQYLAGQSGDRAEASSE